MVSYASLETQVNGLALRFQAGVRVAGILGISIEAIVLFLAVSAAGGVWVPGPPEGSNSDFEHLFQKVDYVVLDDAGVTRGVASVVADKIGIPVLKVHTDLKGIVHLAGELHAVPQFSFSSTALILHTSGTTSRPKAVPLTHTNLLASVENIRAAIPLTSTDLTFNVMPLFHVHGLVGCVLATLCSGGTLVLPSSGRFSASRFWGVMHAFNITWFSAVPTIHRICHSLFVSSEKKELSLKFIRSSSSGIDPGLQASMEQSYRVPILQAYGMTEAAYQVCSNSVERRKSGTVGCTHGTTQIRISSDGEVQVKGPHLMRGYEGGVEDSNCLFTPDGFFCTGDLGEIDSEGFLTLTGRIKDLINRAGEKISPTEIDLFLLQHPLVREAVAFAIPDEMYGEVVGAAVVCDRELGDPELLRFLNERLAKHKVPSRIFFLQSELLPKTATGKVSRSALAKHVLAA